MNTVRKAILLILVTLAFAAPVHSQGFVVKSVSQDLQEALLSNRDTGEQEVARVGDEIEGWRIVEISQHYVAIAKRGQGTVIFVTKIPVRGGGGLIRVEPQGVGN